VILLKPIVAAAACLAASAVAVHAEVETTWNEHPNSRVRLIAGGEGMIGVELQLAPGWKTYWRMPGDAGVPPSFEWEGSENVNGFDVLYPAPVSMSDQGGTAVGYKGNVIFPVKLERVAGKSAKVALEFSYGVCKDVCIPIDSKLSLTLPPSALKPSTALHAALALVPRPTTEPAKASPALVASTYELAGPSPHVTFKTRGAADVFVEAPDGLFVPLTQKKDEKDGVATYIVDLSKSPDLKDLAGKPLRVTITAPNGNGGIETMLLLK
jgi:DsbC/DsbD-like thiol-disulfide interchange protein